MPFQSKLKNLLTDWQGNYTDKEFPGFDHRVLKPPHTLILLESPGPKVVNTQVVSIFNPDPTAIELSRLLSPPFYHDDQSSILLWNAVPWFLDCPLRASDISEAKPLHNDLLKLLLPNLKCVLLLGKWARQLHPFYSTRVGDAYIYGGHHTGMQAQIQLGLRTENEAIFARFGKLIKQA